MTSFLAAAVAELCAEIQASKADPVKWLVPLLLGQATLIAALVRLLRARGRARGDQVAAIEVVLKDNFPRPQGLLTSA